MGVKVVVANQKGGTGKTTSTILLSYLLSREGLRVLAVDFDPQACLTISLRAGGPDISKALESLLVEYEEKVNEGEEVDPTKIVDARKYVTSVEFLDGRFDVVPSSRHLGTVERRLNDAIEGERVLSWFLDGLDYDVVLIDTRPAIDALLTNALVAGNYVLVPVDLNSPGLVGFKLLVSVVNRTKNYHNRDLKWLGVLPTRFERCKEMTKNLKILKEKVGDVIKVYDPVPKSVAVERMFHARSVEELTKSVRTAKDVLGAYENVAKDIVKLVGGEKA